MEIETFLIDAFTDEPLKGNPAAVCMLQQALAPGKMQAIAAEMNLSETAFVCRQADHFTIRYFTPSTEVEFCGHASMAAAKLLLENTDRVQFITHYGLALAAHKQEKEVSMILPLFNAVERKVSRELYQAFNIAEPVHAAYAAELDLLVIEVKDKATLLGIDPDFTAALKAPDQLKELVVTCRAEEHEADFYSRCFCPWIGINEDPVTGAAHSVLASYWRHGLNKTSLKAKQLSKRGGHLRMKILSETQMELTGNAVIILRGTMYL